MWIAGLIAALAGAVVGRVNVVLAQEQLDPVRDNLSLPQAGLSVLTSLAAVVGALLKGELRAESSHKDVLLPVHAIMNRKSNLFTHEFNFEDNRGGSDYFCHAAAPHAPTQLAVRSTFQWSQDTRNGITMARSSHMQLQWLWRLALWLETKGYPSLKEWYMNDPPEVFKSAHACMIVEDTSGHMLSLHTFLRKIRLAWFRFNCDHVVRMVIASHPHDCSWCLEMSGLAWPAVLRFIPRESWGDIQLADQTVRLNCVGHGGCSLIAQALMEGSMGYKDHQRLAIMLIQPDRFAKSCLPKAYCALDAVERNTMTNMAKLLVADSAVEEGPTTGPMRWSCGRRAVALSSELIIALILCWAAQMPPLSAALVGRRLVRSHSTGAWANSTLFIAAGNEAQVVTVAGRISFFDISTSLSINRYALVALLETFLILTAILAEYICWMCVLTGVLPPLFGAPPKARAPLLKACSASVLLSLCFFLSILKSCNQRLVPEKKDMELVVVSLTFYMFSQVATWCIYVFATARLRVALLGLAVAGFGELMWLTSMWSGAHHPALADSVTWARTAAHIAPYLSDAGASLIIYL